MEVDLTVRVSLPDKSLEEVLANLTEDGSDEGYTLVSLFWEEVATWLQGIADRRDMAVKVLASSDPNYERLLGSLDAT